MTHMNCLKILEQTGLSLDKFLVDIGSSDGKETSPVYHLFRQGWKGLAIEPDRNKVGQFKRNLPNIPIIHGFAGIPLNLDIPQGLDVIKVDIDSFDYWIARAATKYRPKLLVVEINRSIAPPIRMTLKYNPELFKQDKVYNGCCITHLPRIKKAQVSGCSLQILTDGMNLHGYKLIQLNYIDAYFVRDDIKCFDEISVNDAYYAGFLNNTESYYGGGPLPKGKQPELMKLSLAEKMKFYTNKYKEATDLCLFSDLALEKRPWLFKEAAALGLE